MDDFEQKQKAETYDSWGKLQLSWMSCCMYLNHEGERWRRFCQFLSLKHDNLYLVFPSFLIIGFLQGPTLQLQSIAFSFFQTLLPRKPKNQTAGDRPFGGSVSWSWAFSRWKEINVPLATACSGARAGRASVRGRGRGRSGQLRGAIERSPSPVAKRMKAGGLRVTVADDRSWKLSCGSCFNIIYSLGVLGLVGWHTKCRGPPTWSQSHSSALFFEFLPCHFQKDLGHNGRGAPKRRGPKLQMYWITRFFKAAFT